MFVKHRKRPAHHVFPSNNICQRCRTSHMPCPFAQSEGGWLVDRGGCVPFIPGAGAVVRSQVGHLRRFDTAADDGF